MSDPAIPGIQQFQNLTLKIQGPAHGWGQSYITWLQHSVDSHPFRSMSIRHPVPELWLFQNLTLKIKGQGHGWIVQSHKVGLTCYRLHPFRSMSIWHPIAELRLFQNLTWNSRVKVMGKVTVQSHNVGLTSYRLTSLSFHVNQPSHSWVMMENFAWKSQGHGWGLSSNHNVI